ncbi:MAG: RNA-directed DNA polymerase [Candidatus Desulfofervidus auxilii]|nr:RNA-directed DNA polymerase [Candidatus Desulfofervidus auxilii]
MRGNNPVPDILGFLHLKHLFKPDFSTEIESLFEKYAEEKEIPEPLLRIDVPKENFTIRPMARPSVRDWLIYEAIIDYLAKEILKKEEICQRSFSILNFKGQSKKKTDAWLKFDECCREYYKNGYKYCVTTDLTGYYENINLQELRKRILNYLGDNRDKLKIIKALFHLLRKWSDERISEYGLPQGPPASAFLADIYLDHVDRQMEKYEGYFRYMDDIRIFCKREIETKIALKDLIIALRNVKLNINAKKTSILKGGEIEEKLFDPHKSLLDIIDTLMKSGNKKLIEEKVIPALLKIFEDAFSNDPFEKTHLNFSLYRLSILKNSGFNFDTTKIIKTIKDNFISKPHHTGLFCDFLSMFPNDENIVKFLLEFLKSENNIYEWQELKILQTLLKFNVRINRENIEFFLNSAKGTNKHYAVRGFYFLLAGKYGNNRDRELIVDSYDSLSETYTKLAVILAVQELGKASRNDFYSRVKRRESDVKIKQFVDYVKSLKSPIYYLTTEKPKIETYEEFEGPIYEYN